MYRSKTTNTQITISMIRPDPYDCLPEHEIFERALCRTAKKTPSFFHPKDQSKEEDAQKFCLDCPVRVPCLNWSLDEDLVEFGVYGGATPSQRRELRRERNKLYGRSGSRSSRYYRTTGATRSS